MSTSILEVENARLRAENAELSRYIATQKKCLTVRYENIISQKDKEITRYEAIISGFVLKDRSQTYKITRLTREVDELKAWKRRFGIY